jgi:hypothetical protein
MKVFTTGVESPAARPISPSPPVTTGHPPFLRNCKVPVRAAIPTVWRVQVAVSHNRNCR